MKQLYFTILLLPLLLAGFQMNAQGYYFYDDRHYEGTFIVETGIKSGILNAFTDIGGKSGPGKQFIKDLNPVFSRPCFGFYSSLMYKERIGIRIQYTSGTITAADSILKSVRQSTGGRYERNLSFRSPIREFALLIEIHPLNFRNDFLREKEPSASRLIYWPGPAFLVLIRRLNWMETGTRFNPCIPRDKVLPITRKADLIH